MKRILTALGIATGFCLITLAIPAFFSWLGSLPHTVAEAVFILVIFTLIFFITYIVSE